MNYSLLQNPFLIVTCFILGYLSESAVAAIEFEDVSAQAGFTHSSRSYGACWGDYDGDGWLDLYAGNHSDEHSLYHNRQDGTFEEVHETVMPWIKRDAHGCMWADFDRDGDQDMILLSGGNGGGKIIPNNFNQLYVNEGGVLTDQAASFELELGYARARTPLWFDYNRDGYLDLISTHLLHPDRTGASVVMEQISDGFIDATADVGFELDRTVRFAQLSDLSGDGILDLLAWQGPGSVRIFDVQSVPFEDISADINGANFSAGSDVAIADFDGDLRPDIYIANQVRGDGEVIQPNPQELRMGFGARDGAVSTVRFAAAGNIDVRLQAPFLAIHKVYIGESRYHPADWDFTLRPDIGLPNFQPGSDTAIYLGYDDSTNEWVFTLSIASSIQAATPRLNAIVNAESVIDSVQSTGFNANGAILADEVKINTVSGFRDRTSTWLPGRNTPSTGVVSGDFDNDGDVDIYVVNSYTIANQPNTLYENQGDHFSVVANAGGAAGSTDGVGDNAVVADFDRDGFLDLYVMNGGNSPLFGHAVHQLFHNKGNQNHWLQIDLAGVESDPHGIGARLILEAGDITLMREQNAGVHQYQANGHRVHFGLGSSTMVDKLTIQWPSGQVQELADIAVDQIITVREDGAASPPPPPAPSGEGVLGGVVWEDLNGDGIKKSGEQEYQGMVVELYNCNGSEALDSTTTNDSGEYRFEKLDGRYKIRFVSPTGYTFSPLKQGTQRGKDSDADPDTGFTSCRSLTGSQTSLGLGAGIVPEGFLAPTGNATLGGNVWKDLNGNGMQDSGEPKYQGMEINLYDCNGSTILESTSSDGRGKYLFNGLDGRYKVRFVLPTGYAFSPLRQGTRRGKDSDADPDTGFTSCRAVSDGTSLLGLDAGLIAQ